MGLLAAIIDRHHTDHVQTAGVIILAIILVLFVLFIVGIVVNSRHRRASESTVRERAISVDQELATAAALDKGWDRAVLEAAVREAWAQRSGAAPIEAITLMAVIDRPGTDEDRADFAVTAGGTNALVALARTGDRWFEAGGAQPSGSSPPSA